MMWLCCMFQCFMRRSVICCWRKCLLRVTPMWVRACITSSVAIRPADVAVDASAPRCRTTPTSVPNTTSWSTSEHTYLSAVRYLFTKNSPPVLSLLTYLCLFISWLCLESYLCVCRHGVFRGDDVSPVHISMRQDVSVHQQCWSVWWRLRWGMQLYRGHVLRSRSTALCVTVRLNTPAPFTSYRTSTFE